MELDERFLQTERGAESYLDIARRVRSGEGRFLQRTLASSFEPGTNRKGRVLGGAWTLLLDSLELGRVVCLGVPAPRTLRALTRRARGVTVLCADVAELDRARESVAEAGSDDVVVASASEAAGLEGADLVVLASPSWARRADGDADLSAMLQRAGSVFADLGDEDAPLPPKFGRAQPLWLGVSGDEVELAAGLHDEATIALLRRPAAAESGGVRTTARARTKALLRGTRAQGRKRERRGALIVGDDVAPGRGAVPPAYLRNIAAAAGVPVDDCRVGLVATPDYPSRKAILFLLPAGSDTPLYVVKIPRDGAFNDRLENEWRGLSLLAEAGIGDAATVPRPVFFGYHAGLAVLGQTTVTGTPFRQRTDGTPSCPLASSGIAWLEDLAAATIDTSVSRNSEIAEGLRTLLTRFSDIYRPTAIEYAVLASLIDRIHACPRPVPLVFQHGDPGTWNLLITADGRPAFLDWEAAEPHGMPLWDLFYFVRSFGITVSGARGKNTLRGFADQFLADTPVSRGLAELVDRHCNRIGLDRDLAEPLFFTCWMHRALKEAMRLSPGELERGRYYRLLRLCIECRDVPALRRVFGG